jgi:hypothetical protein
VILLLKVYFATSFNSKQLKLEPKLVSALSITKCLFQLFRVYTETESFGVLIEPEQTEEQPKQFNIELILVFFQKIKGFSGLFRMVLVCFKTVCFGCFASIPKQRVSMFRFRNKPKTNQNSLKERIFWYFPENLGCFGLFWFVLKQFCLFQIFLYRFETLKQTNIFCFWFHKTNRNRSCLVFFLLEPIFFCLFRGHPTPPPSCPFLQQF